MCESGQASECMPVANTLTWPDEISHAQAKGKARWTARPGGWAAGTAQCKQLESEGDGSERTQCKACAYHYATYTLYSARPASAMTVTAPRKERPEQKAASKPVTVSRLRKLETNATYCSGEPSALLKWGARGTRAGFEQKWQDLSWGCLLQRTWWLHFGTNWSGGKVTLILKEHW